MVHMPVMLNVTQLNTYIKSLFDGDENLMNVYLAGEISNFTDHYKSGHLYFSLKDDKSVIRAVMFAQSARRLRFLPQNGMSVIVHGRVSVYEATGQYQLYVEDMQPDGLGALNLAFEQLKSKLEAEGLFSAARKKPLPRFPERIGVITSPTGAAVHDIITVLNRRYPMAQVVFCPVLVQGAGAAPQIVDALERFNRVHCADVIILGRGGGSLEDLWPFNEECVARAVAASDIPVISAVGHETDFTICDFAADLRAPTPSAAAELAVPDQEELLETVFGYRMLLKRSMAAKLEELKKRLHTATASYPIQRPLDMVHLQRLRADRLSERLSVCMNHKLSGLRSELCEKSGKLHTLSPLATLSRGYAIVYRGDGSPVSSTGQVETDEAVSIRLRDGILGCVVGTKEEIHE